MIRLSGVKESLEKRFNKRITEFRPTYRKGVEHRDGFVARIEYELGIELILTQWSDDDQKSIITLPDSIPVTDVNKVTAILLDIQWRLHNG